MRLLFTLLKKKCTYMLYLLLVFKLSAQAQGPFVGANFSPRGFAGIRAGWSYYGLLDLSLHVQPINYKRNNGGYSSASIKIPLRYLQIANYFESSLIGGLFVNYNAGVMFKPLNQTEINNSNSFYSKPSYAGSWSLGTEILFMKSGFAFSLPIEFGHGKILHNQEFQKQIDIITGEYSIKKGYFISAGIRFYFSKNHCKEATRG